MTVSTPAVADPENGAAVTKYNGTYRRQGNLISGQSWWKHGTKDGDTGTIIYWSESHDRWVVEAPDVIWESSEATPNSGNDERRFSGLQNYFGGQPSYWTQLSVSEEMNGRVEIGFECYDTGFPTQQPTDQPSQQPTDQPTQQPQSAVDSVVDLGF